MNDIFSLDHIDFQTDGRFIPTLSCKVENTKLLSKRKKLLKCEKRNAISKIKTHTSSKSGSGSDANIKMTFGLYNSETNKLEHECEPISPSRVDNHGNDKETGQTDPYEIANLGKKRCQKFNFQIL